jgi:hypothetical protein
MDLKTIVICLNYFAYWRYKNLKKGQFRRNALYVQIFIVSGRVDFFYLSNVSGITCRESKFFVPYCMHLVRGIRLM